MKLPRILLSALAIGAIATVSLQAQEKGKGRGMNPDQIVARYDETLTLTAEQKTKIKDIITANQEKAKSASQEERRTIMQGQRDQIRAVLTPEQQKKFDAMPQRAPGGKKKKSE